MVHCEPRKALMIKTNWQGLPWYFNVCQLWRYRVKKKMQCTEQHMHICAYVYKFHVFRFLKRHMPVCHHVFRRAYTNMYIPFLYMYTQENNKWLFWWVRLRLWWGKRLYSFLHFSFWLHFLKLCVYDLYFKKCF